LPRPRTTTPTKPDDARAQRSIEALRMAILQLVEEKPLEQVSIREITDTAGLSYPTFFRRFASKDELIEDIATEEVANFLALGRSAFARRHAAQSADAMIRYVHTRRKLWTTLLNGGAATAMRKEFMRIAREISEEGPRVNAWMPVDLGVPFVTSGIFELFAWWLRQPDDYPIENVLKLFSALIIEPSARRRDIGLV
jgi:AcrR family transcriptional regulator